MSQQSLSISIQVITADQRQEFHPQQWVNVWIVDVTLRSEYMQTCQVQDIDPDAMGYAPEELILEPMDEDGQPMTYRAARQRRAATL